VVIEHSVHRQFGENDDLLNRQNRAPLRQVDVGGNVAGHQAGLGQGFAGMDQQAFAVLFGGNLEHRAGFVKAQGQGVGFEVVVEGAFGGFVEFLRIGGFVGRGVVGFWRIGCWLFLDEYSVGESGAAFDCRDAI